MPKAVVIFWLAVAGIVGVGIGVLQVLGPPPAPKPQLAVGATAAAKPAIALTLPKPPSAPVAQAVPLLAPVARTMGTGSLLPPGAPIPAPMPALLSAALSNPNLMVPRIAPSGLTPMQAYAATAPAAAGPRVAFMVAGMADDDALSEEAITNLPAAVSLAITPYGQHITDIAAQARAAGHEILLALPMQELDPASENAGNEALVVAGPITLDQPMLDWNMAQLQGYAGVTDAIGITQGAGFMNNDNAKSWLLQEVADKGLFFVDARPTGRIPYAWGRNADVVIDTINAPQNEAALLADLATISKMQGTALGVLLNPSPNALQMLSIWLTSLAAQNITLVPVSALVLPPNAPITALAPAPAAQITPAPPVTPVAAVTP